MNIKSLPYRLILYPLKKLDHVDFSFLLMRGFFKQNVIQKDETILPIQ